MPETNNNGVIKPIDPLLSASQENANKISEICAEALRELQIPTSPKQGDGQDDAVLRAAQDLLVIPYGRTVRDFLKVEPEKIDEIAQSRGHDPLAFVDATLSLMQSFGDDLVRSSGPQILPIEELTLPRALAIGCLLAEPALPEPSRIKANKVIGKDPMALGILTRLRATPAVK